MAKRPAKKRFWKFPIGMLVYALVFLGAAALGLNWFWGYIDAYERSRPETAMDAYMEKVDADYLCAGGSAPILDAIDLNIQSEDACLDYIRSTLTGQIRYAQKMSECTENKMVYMVMCGKLSVCKVTLIPQPADEYGFTRWMVASEEFDLSHVQSSTAAITVPYDFSVYLGGTLLEESYITESKIPYPEVAEYYDSYSPPYLVTYQSGAFLGELSFEVADPQGNPVTIDENTDMTVFLNNCTPEETAQLDPLVESFVQGYVDFLSCANNEPQQNYQKLTQFLVPGCELSKRFLAALDGMSWTKDRNSEVTALVINHRVDLGGGRYLCDVTYEVDTRLHSGPSHETSNVHLIIAATDSGMKVESMTIQ